MAELVVDERPPRDPTEQVDLFEFLRTVAVAAGRGQLTRMQAAVATLTALDSDKTTGTGVVVKASQTAVELGISERRVWVHFKALVDAEWFEQTAKPAKGSGGPGTGRRARYRCLRPQLDLGLTDANRLTAPRVETSDDQGSPQADRVTAPSVETSHGFATQRLAGADPKPSRDQPIHRPTSDGFTAQRLMVSGSTSDGPERENGTLPTSGGTTSDGSTTPVALVDAQPQDARKANCQHLRLTVDGDCMHCPETDLCKLCVQLIRNTRGKVRRCYQHQEATV